MLFKWRHSELELKAQHIKRQITLIESKRFDEEAAMKDALDKYTRLRQFKDQGAAALLAEWGVAHLPKRTIMTSPRAKAVVSPRPPAYSGPRTGSPLRCKTAQAQSSVERSSPNQALNKATTTKQKVEESPLSDNPYQFKNEKQDINLAEILGAQPGGNEALKELTSELKKSFISQKPLPLKLLNGASPLSGYSAFLSGKKGATRNPVKPQHNLVSSSSFNVKPNDSLDSKVSVRGTLAEAQTGRSR